MKYTPEQITAKLEKVHNWLERIYEGVWVPQDDCSYCGGKGHTVFDSEAGCEYDECHCLIPEDRTFNASAPDLLEELTEIIQQQAEKIVRLKGELEAKLVFINNGWEEERYSLQERLIKAEGSAAEAWKAYDNLKTEMEALVAEIDEDDIVRSMNSGPVDLDPEVVSDMREFLFTYEAYGAGMVRYTGEITASGEDQEEATNRAVRKLHASAGPGITIRITGVQETE